MGNFSSIDYAGYITEMVYELVPGVQQVSANRLNFRCPICGDGKKGTSRRGYFYTDTASYFCFNAGCPANEHGMSGIKFLSEVSGKTPKEIKEEIIKRSGLLTGIKREPVISSAKPLFQAETQKHETVMDKLDFGKWTTKLPSMIEKYVKDRKLDLAQNLTLYYDRNSQRLVIPWSNDYWQERLVFNDPKNPEPKYLFPPEVDKPVYGLDKIDPTFKYIFLLEGVFDSVWVKNGVAVGSLKMSNNQKKILEDFVQQGYQLIWMPDNQFKDASSRKETEKIFRESKSQKVFLWNKKLANYKDVNETVIASDKFIELWKNEKFLLSCIESGLHGLITLKGTL